MYNEDSRTKNSIKSITYTVGGQLLKELLSFLVRTVFVKVLSIEYLGVNGLFTNILYFLSLAEMGVGSALIFSMYKPMAEHDEEKLKIYMNIYKRVYLYIGIFVHVIGFALIPFLDFFMKTSVDIPNLRLIYVLFVINTGSTYFFAYKGSIFQADQRAFVVTKNTSLFNIIQSLVRILVLVTTRNFILYLSASIVVTYVQNFTLARKADVAYPFIKEKTTSTLSKEEQNGLKKNIFALLLHKIGTVVLNSSDNLIISKFIGVITVGLYSNYSLITNAVKTTFDMVLGAVGTSVGNLCAKETKEKAYQVHKSILLLNIWLASFCVISLYNLLNPFVAIWLGEDYLLPVSTVLAVVVSFYIQVTMRTSEMFKSASGLFWNDRFAPAVQCVINIVVSVILAKSFGITGVFVGTSIAMLSTKWWITPYVLYKNKFQVSFRYYLLYYGKYSLAGIFSFLLTAFACNVITFNSVPAFICKMIVCALLPNLIFLLLFFRSNEFQYCIRLISRGRFSKIFGRFIREDKKL